MSLRSLVLIAFVVLSCKKSVPAVEDATVRPVAYLDARADAGVYRGTPVFESRDAFEKQMRLSADSPGSDEYLRSLLSLKREPAGTRVSVIGTESFSYKGTTVAYDEVEVLDGADKGKHFFVMATVVRTGEPPPELTAALAAGPVDAAVPPPKSAAEAHRDEMEKAANEGRYTDVCSGTPTFPPAVCAWAAARAQGKTASKPDWTVFVAFINREHIKKVSGRIVGDGEIAGEYEAIVYGYRRHCIVTTFGTTFTTKGAFSLWVQELPQARQVTTSAGGTENWVELEENDLGKDLSDLTYAHGVEAEALAKDIMMEVAKFVPYAELKGDADAGG